MKRDPYRRRSQLGSWMTRYGVRRLTKTMIAAGEPVTEMAVYNWLAGRHVPRTSSAIAIVSISRGRVSLEDIFRHRRLMARRQAPPRQG